jgi:hypothetical protein
MYPLNSVWVYIIKFFYHLIFWDSTVFPGILGSWKCIVWEFFTISHDILLDNTTAPVDILLSSLFLGNGDLVILSLTGEQKVPGPRCLLILHIKDIFFIYFLKIQSELATPLSGHYLTQPHSFLKDTRSQESINEVHFTSAICDFHNFRGNSSLS